MKHGLARAPEDREAERGSDRVDGGSDTVAPEPVHPTGEGIGQASMGGPDARATGRHPNPGGVAKWGGERIAPGDAVGTRGEAPEDRLRASSEAFLGVLGALEVMERPGRRQGRQAEARIPGLLRGPWSGPSCG